MLISKTPLRISLLGGGTDFPDFYRTEPGCVLCTTIDKYVYVMLTRRFDEQIRVSYTRTEIVDNVAAVEHDLVREALQLTGIPRGVEVATMAEIPSRGSGLGSSSSVVVGLLQAMWRYQGRHPTADELAEGACHIEIDRLGRPIGKQDQYAAAWGGLNVIRFDGDSVTVRPAGEDPRLAADLARRLMLFYTGIGREAGEILMEQRANIEAQRGTLRTLRRLAEDGLAALQAGELDAIGGLLHESWQYKRTLASKVTNPTIDAMLDAARRAGAIGGKVSGAGGGGFLLLYVPLDRQAAVRATLHGLRELDFGLEPTGSRGILEARPEVRGWVSEASGVFGLPEPVL